MGRSEHLPVDRRDGRRRTTGRAGVPHLTAWTVRGSLQRRNSRLAPPSRPQPPGALSGTAKGAFK
jgi:hypothetical protein